MLKKIIRPIHTWIVKKYLPEDHETELADALFNWKYCNNAS